MAPGRRGTVYDVDHPRETVERYAAIYRRREQERRAREEEAARTVLGRLPEAARALRDEFGARVVGYFGSLRRGRLHERSDVDLFVDRIRRGEYFRAIDRLCTLLARPVDLVELEAAPPSLRERIATDGVVIDA